MHLNIEVFTYSGLNLDTDIYIYICIHSYTHECI